MYYVDMGLAGWLGGWVTLAKTEIIYPKNVRAKVAMDFTSDKYSAPKILGAVLELPAKQHW